MIKKIITLLFLFFLLTIINEVKKEPETKLVFNYLDNDYNDYQIYTLSFNNININTKNFNIYFSNPNIQVLGIYPKLNPLYSEKISQKISYYVFTNSNNKKNIETFSNYYLNILSEYGLSREKEKIYFQGIKIDKVKVYTSEYYINKFINKYPKITYR